MRCLSRPENQEKPVNIELSPRHRENAPGAGGKAEIMKSQISNYPGREKNSIHQGVPAAITSTGSYRPLTNSRPGANPQPSGPDREMHFFRSADPALQPLAFSLQHSLITRR